jgi:hypothetical protein
MSYYYDDTSHYCYTVPAHYEDSNYSYSVPDHYQDHESFPEPIYYVDAPSEPVYYDDTPSDTFYCDDVPPYDEIHPAYLNQLTHPADTTTWSLPSYPSSPQDTTSYEIANELELESYAETASLEIPTWDELHPIYRNQPAISNSELIQLDTSHVYEPSHDYTTSADPIIDYDINYDNYSDEKLVQEAEYWEEMLEEMRVWDAEDAENRALGRKVPGVNPPAQPYCESIDFKRIAQTTQQIASIQRGRIERIIEDEASEDCDDEEGNNDNSHSIYLSTQPLSPPLSHHELDNTVNTIPPPDIFIPNPLPLSPNIRDKPITSAFLITAIKRREPRYYFGSPIRRRRLPQLRTRTTSPPDIRTPQPFPPSPNIPTRLHFCSLVNRHPPSIHPPKPFPPAPNISIRLPYPPHLKPWSSSYQQPQRPAYTRPRRKHPPHSMYRIHPLIPHHHHNVIRRILKKSHSHSL